MTETRRRRSPRGAGEQLREALLTTAVELLDTTYDVDGLSVRTLTSATGVSPTALYLHFADLDEVVRAVKQRCFAELGDRLAAVTRLPADNPAALLRAACHEYLDYASEHPGHYALMFHVAPPARRTTAEPPTDVRTAGVDTFGVFVRVVAQALGRPDDAAAFEVASGLWMSLHGRAHLAAAMPWFGLPAQDRYVTLLVEQLLG